MRGFRVSKPFLSQKTKGDCDDVLAVTLRGFSLSIQSDENQALAFLERALSTTVAPAPASSRATTENMMVPAAPVSGN